MKKTLCIIFAVLLFTATLCACTTQSKGSKSIVGSWTGSSEGVSFTMTFEGDGTGSVSALGGMVSEDFTYTIEGSTLKINVEDENAGAIEYSIDGDTLSLSADGETITLTKD